MTERDLEAVCERPRARVLALARRGTHLGAVLWDGLAGASPVAGKVGQI